jgi:hypothetical protein
VKACRSGVVTTHRRLSALTRVCGVTSNNVP